MAALTGADALAFFDAIAPIVHRDTIDFGVAWMQSRYDKGGGGRRLRQLPARPRTAIATFVAALLAGAKTEFHEWEKTTPYFDGCLPIEVMAARGPDTLRWGPMKPVGLTDPRTGRRPHAVVQLRQDNALGTLYNMVGFQTKLRHGEQTARLPARSPVSSGRNSPGSAGCIATPSSTARCCSTASCG